MVHFARLSNCLPRQHNINSRIASSTPHRTTTQQNFKSFHLTFDQNSRFNTPNPPIPTPRTDQPPTPPSPPRPDGRQPHSVSDSRTVPTHAAVFPDLASRGGVDHSGAKELACPRPPCSPPLAQRGWDADEGGRIAICLAVRRAFLLIFFLVAVEDFCRWGFMGVYLCSSTSDEQAQMSLDATAEIRDLTDGGKAAQGETSAKAFQKGRDESPGRGHEIGGRSVDARTRRGSLIQHFIHCC